MNNGNTNISNCPVIAGVSITTDKEGRFNLNALHKASGLGNNKAPAQWLRTQTAQELVHELTDMQKCTSPINTIKGGINQGTFAHELLAVSYAGWISPKFQLMVNQVFLDYKKGHLNQRPVLSHTGLAEFRKSRSIMNGTKAAEIICNRFTNLSQEAQQVIFAKIVNSAANEELIPLPKLENKTYTAGEVGEQLGVTSNMVGRIANKLGLKTEEYGMIVLDKSRHSDKQVETFRYSQKAIDVIKNHLINKEIA